MTGLWLVSYAALWVLNLAMAVVLVSVLRNLGTIYTSLSSSADEARPRTKLTSGERLPEVSWQTFDGEQRNLSEFSGAKRAFAIISPGCGPCADYLDRILHGSEKIDPLDGDLADLVVVSLGTPSETMRVLESAHVVDDMPVLLDSAREVTVRWGVSATPATVVVDEQLRVVRQIFGSSNHTEPTATVP